MAEVLTQGISRLIKIKIPTTCKTTCIPQISTVSDNDMQLILRHMTLHQGGLTTHEEATCETTWSTLWFLCMRYKSSYIHLPSLSRFLIFLSLAEAFTWRKSLWLELPWSNDSSQWKGADSLKLVFCCQIFIAFHGFSPFFLVTLVASTDSRSSDDYCITFCMLWVVDLECWLVTSRRPVQPPCVRQIWTCCHLVWLSHGIQMVLMVVADEGRRWPWHHGHSTVLICGSKTT